MEYIYIFIETCLNIEKYFNKIKCQFESHTENNQTISSIKLIEKMILNKFHLSKIKH